MDYIETYLAAKCFAPMFIFCVGAIGYGVFRITRNWATYSESNSDWCHIHQVDKNGFLSGACNCEKE
jgi:hypothetical protein